MRQKKRKTMEKETRHQRRHDSLHCPRVKCNCRQVTNWSVSSLKGKLKFFRFKIVKYETRAFKRKIELKPILVLFICFIFLAYRERSLLILLSVFCVGFYAQFHRPPAKQLVHALACTIEFYIITASYSRILIGSRL